VVLYIHKVNIVKPIVVKRFLKDRKLQSVVAVKDKLKIKLQYKIKACRHSSPFYV